MTVLADSDHGLRLEALYTAHAVYEPRVLDDWPLADGDIRTMVFVAVIEAVRSVRRERGRLATPWLLRALELQAPTAVYEAAAKWLSDLPPYEPEIEPIVLSLRERGACARAHEIAQQITKASSRGKWTEVQKLQSELAAVRASGQHAHRIHSKAEAMREGIAPAVESGGAHAIPFDSQLDRIIKLEPKTRLFVGADTNVGKTSLVAHWLDEAERQGTPAAFISCEDAVPMLGRKWLASIAAVSAVRVRDGKLSPDEMGRAARAIDEARSARLWMVHIEDRTLSGVLSAIRSCAALGAKVVAIDYLQAIRVDQLFDRRKDAIDHMVNEILACCSVCGVALILVSQLVRRDGGMPKMRDFKESGDIENSATWVVLVWREKDASEAPIYGLVAKVKEGSGIGHIAAWQRNDHGVLVESDQQPDVPDTRRRNSYGGSF